VDYNATGGTAVNGEDYELDAGTLVFDPCELTKYISVVIVEDEFEEDPDETIEITLSNPTKSKLGINTQHTFTILPGTVQPCPKGDLDGDCDVDFNDVDFFVFQWLDPPGSCGGYMCANMDGLDGVDMRDFALLADNWLVESWPIKINEFMASNGGFLTDPEDPNDTPDWFELYNAGPLPIDLAGMYVTDDLGDPGDYYEIPPGITIPSGGYLLFYADEDDGEGPLHTTFALRASGEEICLIDTDGTTLIDRIVFGQQITDISYGRYPDAAGNLRFFATPTPLAENSGAYLDEVADTKFSHKRGFYDSPFALSITCNTGGAEIHYTLDGSEPNEFVDGSTYLYTGPIDINYTTTLRAAAFKPGYLPTNVDTQTYIFLDDVLDQPAMDPVIVGYYGSSTMKEAFKSIPTLSLVKENKYGPTSVELIYPDPNWGEGLQVDCEISQHSTGRPKQAYRLEFKTEFGASRLEYPFFESDPLYADSAVDAFDRIILRSPKNVHATYVGDPWSAHTQIAMMGLGCHSTQVHLYVNGRYDGIYNPKERPDAWFTSSYLGGDFEDYFATNHGIERCDAGSPIILNSPCHLSGDDTRFDLMMNLAYELDLDDPSKYEQFKALCDIQEFADYTILFWFSGFGDNMDNNWYAGMRNVPLEGSVPPEGFMMFMWDAEYVFLNRGGPPGNEDPWVPYYYFYDGYMISDIWLALFDNEDFRMLFADRVYKHCFNNGALCDENAQYHWDTLTDFIYDAVICEQARWEDIPSTPTAVDMNGHVDIFISELRDWTHPSYPGISLYPDIDPPTFNQHGGHVTTGFGLEMANPNAYGTIYYTLDGNDPREPETADIVGTAYGGAITLNESTHVKARVWDGNEWSAMNEVIFAVGPVADSLRITEIMYHPEDENDPNTEFIELKNIAAESINLNMVAFTNGIDFTFPSLTLGPNQYVVLVKDQNSFEAKYGTGINSVGHYVGRLNNAGERIELEDAVGQTILDFRYRDGWRSIVDGGGYSLTIIDPNDDDTNSWGDKDAWRASAYFSGSPGWDDSGIVPNPGTVVINEVLAHSHLAPDWIELYNTTDSAIDIGGWFLSDSDSNLTKYEIVEGTSIPPGGYMLLYEDANFGNPNDPGCHIPFALSENGEDAALSSWLDPNGNLTGYRAIQDFGASDSNVSFGRYFKGSTGNYNFVAMDHNTPGLPNAYPKVGPIVINEIMYHPNWPESSPYESEKYEYIELRNITNADVNLYDDQGIPWKFTSGIDFTFPAEPPIRIPAGGYMLIVKDPEAFTWRYPDIPVWRILGPYDGQLSNGGEKVEISMPGDIDQFGTLHYIRIDRVNYSDGSHPEDCPNDVDLWPTQADGAGMSLVRIDPNRYGNDPNNWDVNSPTPQSSLVLLFVNEFMADNLTTIQDEHGDYDDWIELCNAGTTTIDLTGMHLTDSLSSPTQWEILAGITIGPGEYVLFWADGEFPAEGNFHTNFGLSKGGGEDVGLFDTDGSTLISGIAGFPAQSTDESYGRYPDGTDNWTVFTSPTPGSSNTD
ncbi:MAG: lamin tail domain-containing protein, partial [Planctomycetota bacterium]|jgi:hypothetical protein